MLLVVTDDISKDVDVEDTGDDGGSVRDDCDGGRIAIGDDVDDKEFYKGLWSMRERGKDIIVFFDNFELSNIIQGEFDIT